MSYLTNHVCSDDQSTLRNQQLVKRHKSLLKTDCTKGLLSLFLHPSDISLQLLQTKEPELIKPKTSKQSISEQYISIRIGGSTSLKPPSPTAALLHS